MYGIEELIRRMTVDGDERWDLSCIIETSGGLEKAVGGFMGMFDREIFDSFVVLGPVSSAIAAAAAYKLGKGMILAERADIRIKKGMKVIVAADFLASGKEIKELIGRLEGLGAAVIRLGFVAELPKYEARKNKVLRGYPFESLAVLN